MVGTQPSQSSAQLRPRFSGCRSSYGINEGGPGRWSLQHCWWEGCWFTSRRTSDLALSISNLDSLYAFHLAVSLGQIWMVVF